KVEAIFNELEFRRMADQFNALFFNKGETTTDAAPAKKEGSSDQFDLFGGGEEGISTSHYNTLENTDHHYQLSDSPMAHKLLLQSLLEQPAVSWETETTGIDPLTAELVGMSFSWEAGKGFYVPVPEGREAAQVVVETFRPFFEAEEIEKIGQNLKYDIKVLQN